MISEGDTCVNLRIQCGCMLNVDVQPGLSSNPFTIKLQPCERCQRHLEQSNNYYRAVREHMRLQFKASQSAIYTRVDGIICKMYSAYTQEDIDELKSRFRDALRSTRQQTIL